VRITSSCQKVKGYAAKPSDRITVMYMNKAQHTPAVLDLSTLGMFQEAAMHHSQNIQKNIFSLATITKKKIC